MPRPVAVMRLSPKLGSLFKTFLRLFLLFGREPFTDELGQQFGKLASFDEACIWVVVKVSFGKRPQPHELNIVRLKKAEIAGLNFHD
jgi:hypothetical protein